MIPIDTADPSAALAAIRAREQAATPGPWRWRNTSGPLLVGARTRIVMAFARMGMNGAQPQFVVDHRLVNAGKDNLNAHPDAAFIAHARDDVRRMADALDAVLALHPRANGYSNGADFDCCGTCFDADEQPETYPCPTVAAITDALGDDR